MWSFLFWSFTVRWLYLVHHTGVTLAGSDLDITETEDGAHPVPIWNQKGLEMKFGCFAGPLGCSAPWTPLSRKQLRRGNCSPLRDAHCSVDLINSLERKSVCWRSTVQLLVDARLRACKLHRESCGLKEMLGIWREQGCSVSPEWCYCQTGIWRCGHCKWARGTEMKQNPGSVCPQGLSCSVARRLLWELLNFFVVTKQSIWILQASFNGC